MNELLSGRSPWLWLGAGVAMIVALLFGIFDDDDSFGGFSDFEALARSSDFEGGGPNTIDSDLQDAIDSIIGGALNGNFDLDDYEPPDISGGINPEEILIVRGTDVLDTLSIQDMLDGNGYGSTAVMLVAEGGREREGILLEDLLEQAGVDEWTTLVITDLAGQSAVVGFEAWTVGSEQFLLYWSSDENPSATLSFSDPASGLRLRDVVQIAVAQ